ncbi:MAG TPA: hypothetical protein VG103_05860 [Chthoniobacterales bacterium]|jgi:hypothetical protein|nr:hypothetical protein [Chthoniobacterales bacterium]
MSERPGSGRSRHGAHRRKLGGWILALIILVFFAGVGVLTYRWLKVRRAERFASSGDSLFNAGKLNDAAVQYRVALQLDPRNYHALVSAARFASKTDRPEAIELWQKVIQLPGCTVQDRQDCAELLIKTNRLPLAEKLLDPLLKNNPDTRTLQLASRYSSKIGEDAKALEFARIASKRAPENDATRFQLAELLARSTDSSEQAEARKIFWELAGTSNAYKQVAIEALSAAPRLTADEQKRLVQELSSLTPRTIKDDLLAADLRLQLQPDNAARTYQETIEHWREAPNEDVISLARWLNIHQQAELVLSSFPIERALADNQLLLARLDAMAILQRWNDIDQLLGQSDVTLDPAVIESFHARTAQERNNTLDAEVHWNHAISLSGTDPFKLRFVANYAEQSRATAAALKAYEQLARFPEHADQAYLGIQRVSQKSGETTKQRAAMAEISARTPDEPNAADQLAYLNLLLGEDLDKNVALAKKLAEQYPNRLAYRVTAALGYLRLHNAALALEQFIAPVPVDWKQTLPAWRAVYAAALLGTDHQDEAQKIMATIPRDQLNPEERALIEANAETKP